MRESNKRHERTTLDYFYLWLKGLIMGASNKVPGVSGGIVALVLDFYEELIYSYQKINRKAWNLIVSGRFKSFWQYINGAFLLTITLGTVSAFFSVSLVLDYMMTEKSEGGLGWTYEVWGVFFGMIIGSIFYVAKRIDKWNWKAIFGIISGATVGLSLSFMDPFLPNDALWFCFLCGMVSVSGMALPGFSGSFLLIIIGNYNLLLVDAVNNLLFSAIAFFTGNECETCQTHLLYVIIVFAIGSMAGMIVFSKIMGYLLKHRYNEVLGVLIGFIAGSLGASWPWKSEIIGADKRILGYERFFPEIDGRFIVQIICIILGIISIFVLDYFEKKKIKE